MALRHTVPVKFAPNTVCDALDSSDVPAGAMAALTNLIPDPSTRNLFQCRPASQLLTSFAGFNTPGFVSCLFIFGTVVYGMIKSNRNPGRDEPFAFDTNASAFLALGGTIDPTTTPISPVSVVSIAWVPPTMDLIGTNIIVTHPGFTGANKFGWFDVTNPAAPTWNAGNLTGAITFTTAPSFVKNFNQRAYYLVNPPNGQPSAVFSDVLVPRNATNANQALTFGDNVRLTALGALALDNQLGGIIAALIVFKSVANTYQITGDAALNNLAINALNITTGTLAPNTVCNTPKGLAFVSPDGVRIIDFTAHISDPVGTAGFGVTVPFIYSQVPSRMAAASGGSILRVAVQNLNIAGIQQEFWFDFARNVWTGPHSFVSSLIVPFSNTFIMTPVGVTAKLFQSDVVQLPTSTFVENGATMTYSWKTSLLPDTDQMSENSMVETTIYMATITGNPISVQSLTQAGTVLDTVSIATVNALYPQRVNWTKPIVFRRMQIQASGNSSLGYKIGRMHLRYEVLGYLQQEAA